MILIGQSNGQGQGENADLTPELMDVPENVELWDKGERILRYDQHRSRHGIEAALLQRLSLQTSERWVLVKYCVGGTSSYAWRPDWTPELADITKDASKGNLYLETLEAVREAERHREEKIAWKYLLVVNGEKEAKYERAARDYGSNLRRIRNAAARDLNSPDLGILVARLSLPEQSDRPYLQEIVRQQELLPWVSTANCTKKDRLHYDASGLFLLGKRFFYAITSGLGTTRALLQRPHINVLISADLCMHRGIQQSQKPVDNPLHG